MKDVEVMEDKSLKSLTKDLLGLLSMYSVLSMVKKFFISPEYP